MATQTLPKASVSDTLGFLVNVAIPNIARGLLIRRPLIVAMAERFQLDTRAVRYMQRLRRKYGTSPLLLPIPLQAQAVILAPQHVHEVLENAPEPFALATFLKRTGLSHFEPKNVLISRGPVREVRRAFHNEVLESERPVHHDATDFLNVVHEEAAQLIAEARRDGRLEWQGYSQTWYRIVRRIVFGDGARDDVELFEILEKLRGNGNWAFLAPKQKNLRGRFLSRVQEYLDRAEPESLAGIIASVHKTEDTAPAQQVPQWLFAFDAAVIASFRALALLASHPEQREQARREIENDQTSRHYLPYLRACILESLRLWPTTPMILRESTRDTRWENGIMRKNTGVIIFAPFFHRDDQNLPYADVFTPELWLGERTTNDWPLVPFSGGPGICPGRQLVLLTTSAMLAALLESHLPRLQEAHGLDPARPLPRTLDHFSLRFQLLPLIQPVELEAPQVTR